MVIFDYFSQDYLDESGTKDLEEVQENYEQMLGETFWSKTEVRLLRPFLVR